MAYALFKLPRAQPFGSGVFLPNARLRFYLTGTSTPTPVYSDSTLETEITQPVEADAAGTFEEIYLDPTIVYRASLYNAADVLQYTVDPANDALFTSELIGKILYPLSDAEIAAGIVAADIAEWAHPHGYVTRYGAIGNDSTNCSAAFQAAFDQAAEDGGAEIFIPTPATAYRITTTITGTNRPIKIRGAGFGSTSAAVPDGGTWVNFVSATSGAACFNFPVRIQGFEASSFGVKLSTNSVDQSAFQFAEILQGNIDSIRFEGTSGATDTNCPLKFLDPVAAIGGLYSGNVNITRCNFTGAQRSIRLVGNCTTFRIMMNEFHGNLPSSASTVGIFVGATCNGARILCNMIEGWQTTGIDDNGVGIDISHNYFENNTSAYDRTGALSAVAVNNIIVSGGAPILAAAPDNSIELRPNNCRVDNAFAEFGLGFRERYRSFNLGVPQTWTPTFSGSGSMTVTSVTCSTQQGSTTLLKYQLVGNTLKIWFRFDFTVGGTPAAEVRFTLPAGFTISGRVTKPCIIFNNAAYADGNVDIQNAASYAIVTVQSFSGSWTAGAAAAYGEIECEVTSG